jgi:hypothetical protein
MSDVPPRIATLVLVDGAGTVVGRLPSFPVASPWWNDMGPLLAACETRFGIRPVVLRLLSTELPAYPGGGVTYLAEVDDAAIPLVSRVAAPWDGQLDDHPLRASWARVGGPAADLRWAEAALARLHQERVGAAVQVRTWNLSSVWRLPLAEGSAWLKVVPPFFAHEGAVIERLTGGPVPPLLARDGPRVLMAEIAGDDRYDAAGDELIDMVSVLVDLQARWSGRTDELLALGVPDWRSRFLAGAIDDVVTRAALDLAAEDRDRLAAFVRGLPARLAAADDTGLPATLVHGDFSPGNVRGRRPETSITLLDWGDSTIGHPLLDRPAFLDRTPARDAEAIHAHWDAAWRTALPGSDPARAARLLAPVAAARQAAVYQRFLDAIEPSERVYHAGDPADWLGRASRILLAER